MNLEIFKDYLFFCVPLGVCGFVALTAFGMFTKMQDNHRKNFKLFNEFQNKIISDLKILLIEREERIRYLEERLDSIRDKDLE